MSKQFIGELLRCFLFIFLYAHASESIRKNSCWHVLLCRMLGMSISWMLQCSGCLVGLQIEGMQVLELGYTFGSA